MKKQYNIKIEKVLPEIKNFKERQYLENVFKKALKKRKKVISAKAAVLFEMIKILNKRKRAIIIGEEIINEENFSYYKFGNRYKVVLSRDFNNNSIKKFIKDFKYGDIISYGSIEGLDDTFASDLIDKIIKKYKLIIDENFWYIIYEPNERFE
jgi:hypothetical protein